MLRGDGYKVTALNMRITAEVLSGCSLLVIVNPVAESNVKDWSLPHSSAFAREEIDALVVWIRGGGWLLLIVDHPPYPGATDALANALGVVMLDAYAGPTAEWPTANVVFGTTEERAWRQMIKDFGGDFDSLPPVLANRGTLGKHPILQGRSAKERIESVVSFAGHAFYPSKHVEPLLVLGANAVGWVPLRRNVAGLKPDDMPLFSVGGWLQGAAMRLGRGRAVILGETAMCTAQVVGPKRAPVGINAPIAPQNAQFCLNVVHWLSGVLGN